MNAEPMKNKHSIKRTVFSIFGSLTVLMFTIYSALSILITFSVEDEVINQLLVTEANFLRVQYEKSPQVTRQNNETITPRLDYMKVYLSLSAMPSGFVKSINQGNSDREIFSDSGEHYHYRPIVLADGKVIYLFAEVSQLLVVTNMSGDILISTLFIFLITLAVSLWFTYLVSQRTSRPIVDLTNAVKKVEATQKVTSLPYRQNKDEIGYLARSLQTSFVQLSSALKREADFTRDVGHELRTPLTIISNTLVLSQNRSFSELDRLALQQQIDNLKNIIDVLMTLARSESINTDKFHLRAHVEECILTMHSALEEQKFSVTLNINDNVVIQANQQLLSLLLSNLLENALSYAANAKLNISATSSQIIFENELVKPIEKQVMNRSVKQSDSGGIGQGLYLVKRIVEALNWQCRIESDDKCFKFIVVTG